MYRQLLPLPVHKHSAIANPKEAKHSDLENTSTKFLNVVLTQQCNLLDPCNPFYYNSLPSVFSSALPSPADGSSSPPPAGDAPPPAWSAQSRMLNPGNGAHWTHTNITCCTNINVLNGYTSEKKTNHILSCSKTWGETYTAVQFRKHKVKQQWCFLKNKNFHM